MACMALSRRALPDCLSGTQSLVRILLHICFISFTHTLLQEPLSAY